MLIKEFLLVLRDKHALAALFIMPCVFILIMSLALKDLFNDHKAMLTVAIYNQAQNAASETFIDSLESNSLITISDMAVAKNDDPDKLKQQFLLMIPADFSLQNGRLHASVASDVSQNTLQLFKAQILQLRLKEQFSLMNSAQIKRAKQAGQPIPNKINFDESKLLTTQYAKLSQGKKPTSTQQSVPSWIVFGLFFVIIPMSTVFINERKQNTLMRLMAMNVSIPSLFAGKIIPYMLINQVQVWLMIAVGVFIVPLFGASALTIGHDITALVILSLALSLAAIGLAMLIATFVDSIEQATTIGGIINILLGAIGGVMVPKFIMPDFMQTFANVSPMSWGLEGYLTLFLKQGTLADVSTEIFALTSFGMVALLLAAMIFKIKIRKII